MKRIPEPFKSLYDRFLAESEEDSSANGYLSYRAEWHSAAWGVAIGFLYAITGNPLWITFGAGWLFTRGADDQIPGYVPYPKQFLKESLYVIGHIPAGALIGIMLKFIVILI